MRVEREMAGIERAIAVQEGGQFPVGGISDRARQLPEQPVMHDQKIHTSRRGRLKRYEAGINCGADFGDAAIVGNLQAVGGAGVVLKGGAARAPVAIGDDLVEGGHALIVAARPPG